MPRTSFTAKQAEALEHTLEHVIADYGFWPTQRSFELIRSIEPGIATELIILKRDWKITGNEILLTVYHNKKARYEGFEGKWHVPGGWVKNEDVDLQAACSRIARRELGINIRFMRKIGEYWWKQGEHPFGRPLSLLMLCEPKEHIAQHDECRFFPVRNLPKNMITVHRNFIETHVPIYS